MHLKTMMCLSVALGTALAASASEITEPPDIGHVLKHLRPDHPRLFLNRDLLEQVQRDGLAPDQQAWLRELRKRVDEYPEPPLLDDALTRSLLGDREVGGEVQAGARSVRVVFQTGGAVGGRIRIAEGDRVLDDRPLATAVQRQAGLLRIP